MLKIFVYQDLCDMSEDRARVKKNWCGRILLAPLDQNGRKTLKKLREINESI